MGKFVGRSNNVSELKKSFSKDFKGLKIQSIEGPAGIGKSTLFMHAITQNILDDKSYLVLRIDGNSTKSRDPVDLIFDLIASAKAESIRDKHAGQIFPYTSNMIKMYKDFQSQLLKEYEQKISQDDSETFLKYLNIAVSLSKSINNISPASTKFINAEGIERELENLKEVIPKLKTLTMESVGVIQKLTLKANKVNIRNQFRENPLAPFSQTLLNDLSAILDKPVDKSKPSPSKIKGIDRLLVVIDDYEALQPLISDFLTKYLLRELNRAGFPTMVVILGRDSLSATSEDWDQYFNTNMFEPMVLKNLSRDEVFDLAEEFGISEPEQKNKIWTDTEGYPYYIQLWREETQSGGLSSVKLKQFYNRTTRWMTETQKKWLESIVFLEGIDAHTIGLMGHDNPNDIKNWFQDEGSIRDPNANPFKFRSFVKSRILEHIKNSDPELYKNNLNQAKSVISKSNKLNEELSRLA